MLFRSCSEIYLEKAFPQDMRPAERLQVARQLGETSLMFLVHPTLSEQDMLDTARAVEKVLNRASVRFPKTLPRKGSWDTCGASYSD